MGYHQGMTGGNGLARIETATFYNDAVTVWTNMIYYLSVGYFGIVALSIAYFSAALFYGYLTNANKVEQMKKRKKRFLDDVHFNYRGTYTSRDVDEYLRRQNNWGIRNGTAPPWYIKLKK